MEITILSTSNELLRLIRNVLIGQDCRESNLQLLALIETKQCWQPTIDLLGSQDNQISFFSANILFTKVLVELILKFLIS
jgi:hypothetical protein